MFRFLATLFVTGAGVLAASAWWGSREAPSLFPELPEPPPIAAPEPAPPAEPASRPAEPRAAASARPSAPAAPVITSRPEITLRPEVAARKLPPIPAPPLPSPAEHSRIVAPAPALPVRIPAPFAPPPARKEVEETRIPEPAEFSDEILELALDDDGFGAEHDAFAGETYGEENVIYVEGDDDVADVFAAGPARAEGDGPFVAADGERSLAMTDHDASAARIRRLLDVYESLGSRR